MTVSELRERIQLEHMSYEGNEACDLCKGVLALITDWRAMRDTLLALEYDGELSAADALNHLRLKP